MVPDLETLLTRTAVSPRAPLDTGALVRRVRRRRQARRLVGAGGGVAVLVLAAALVLPALLRAPAVHLAPGGGAPAGPAPAGATASQTPEEAARDAVVPAIAALPVAERVEVLERIATPEGVWVRSRLPDGTRERARADACGIGAFDDPSALDGRDAVCAEEYGEVLLMDAAEERIVRAFPLPGVPPEALAVAPDAVYCARPGDTALPDAMLCRIDRAALTAHVRVLPAAEGAGYGGGTNRWTPSWWTIEAPGAVPRVLDHVEVDGDAVRVSGPAGSAAVDPATLELGPVEPGA